MPLSAVSGGRRADLLCIENSMIRARRGIAAPVRSTWTVGCPPERRDEFRDNHEPAASEAVRIGDVAITYTTANQQSHIAVSPVNKGQWAFRENLPHSGQI